jgi:2,3,4,5-tetrahydropyridine-2,6-dicarboxylate N-succinyltransferase
MSTATESTLDIIKGLNNGSIRAANKIDGQWQANIAAKEAILAFFGLHQSDVITAEHTRYFDKVPLKFTNYSKADFEAQGARVVPNALVREGAFIGKNTILMPSYVNIGAYVDEGCMIDTWATVGSCAQIGKNVHISGGAGIGGVLEPLQATPTIIEDNCFIGARSEIVEGVVIGEGAVISMGVFIGQSTPIYNRHTQEITYGAVPPYSVVIAGSLPSKDGSYARYAAIIMKQVDERTRSKTAINDLLRD